MFGAKALFHLFQISCAAARATPARFAALASSILFACSLSADLPKQCVEPNRIEIEYLKYFIAGHLRELAPSFEGRGQSVEKLLQKLA